MTRPAFRADGVPAVFGRDLAVLAADGWNDIRARWCLDETADLADEVATNADFDAQPEAHLEPLAITLAQAPTEAPVAVEVLAAPEAPAPEAPAEPDARALANQAGAAIHRQDLAAAEELAERALKQDPELRAALVNYALALELQGKLAEARAAFERGLRVHPDAQSLKDGLARVR